MNELCAEHEIRNRRVLDISQASKSRIGTKKTRKCSSRFRSTELKIKTLASGVDSLKFYIHYIIFIQFFSHRYIKFVLTRVLKGNVPCSLFFSEIFKSSPLTLCRAIFFLPRKTSMIYICV